MPDQPLRVHLVAHHERDRAAGASGATLSLGDALSERGCDVSYYFHDDAFGSEARSEISKMLLFPWRVDAHLRQTAQQFDVIDAATGDAWVWARRHRAGGTATALVTRTHGLEHVADAAVRGRARAGEIALSRKYPIYHGGFHLWEVRQSLVLADAQILPHQIDFDFATQHLGVSAATAAIVPNGVANALLDSAVPNRGAFALPIEVAFIGSWIPRKGTQELVRMASALHRQGASFALRLLGTGLSVADVLSEFPAPIRNCIHVVPRYEPAHLCELLAGAHALVYASWTEGFSLALMEGMARGLVPIATKTGPATTLIRDGENGVLVDGALAPAVLDLIADPVKLARLGDAARRTVWHYRWSSVAEQTIRVYRAAMSRRAMKS